ncbi:uncharacterized protein [Watersipora subatra]|uniref:uncharacterized protein n=1 Tax=Watersipora subatra TaxID=2589382 RepID=UPI00355C9A42
MSCGGNGECLELAGGGFRCICDDGFSSSNCQTDIDDCADSPCRNGNCTDLVADFNCTCNDGYTGILCDIEVDPPINCTNHPPCGDATITREVVINSYTEGESVLYTCITGYRIVGSANNSVNTESVYCERDGTWTATPTCESVVCGLPPNGRNTTSVVSAEVSYPDSYTYTCLPNYKPDDIMELECLFSGDWSLPPPSCTEIQCFDSALPDLPDATFTRRNASVGETVDYICNEDFRLAPSSPTSMIRTQNLTCQSDGTFTALTHSCVYKYPRDCRDYYARDNLFSAAADACVTVTTDADGPTADQSHLPVLCCQELQEICTRVSPISDSSYATVAGQCTETTSEAILPNTEFFGNDSKLCYSTQEVSYTGNHSQIVYIIASSAGICKQQVVTICQASADSLSLVLRRYGESSGFLYGTAIFQPVDGSALLMNVSNSAYTNAVCDCATSGSAVDANARGDCASGCSCTTVGPVSTSLRDTITQYITPDRPAYVTHLQLSQHNKPAAGNLNNGDFIISVGDIECCEVF